MHLQVYERAGYCLTPTGMKLSSNTLNSYKSLQFAISSAIFFFLSMSTTKTIHCYSVNRISLVCPHRITVEACVSHAGCWGARWCRGSSLLGLSLSGNPGNISDRLRLAQGARPMLYAVDPWHRRLTLGVT